MDYCKKHGPVVQLNRMSDSGSGGRGFESRRDHKEVEAQNLAPLPLCFSPTMWIIRTAEAGRIIPNQSKQKRFSKSIFLICMEHAEPVLWW